jgi:PqqD family protein of HPr-rel-A system
MEPDSRWSLNSRFSLRLSAWENEDYGVVYNKTAGKTHLIGVLGISILACLSEMESISNASILKQLLADSGEQEFQVPEELISNSLLELKQLELVIPS